MSEAFSKRWTTDPEYIELLNYLIAKTKDAKSPINIQQLVRDFKEKSGAAQTEKCLTSRIESVRTRIHNFEHIDTKTKVKLIFALSASVDADFLEELKENALVVVDEKNRITKYEAVDGSLKLAGDHSLSVKNRIAKLESNQSLRSLIRNYFENKNGPDAVTKTEVEKEIGNLIDFITEKCENVHSPLSIAQLIKDFNNHKYRFEISIALDSEKSRTTIRERIYSYCRVIQTIDYPDTPTKVKQLFGLSATVIDYYLEVLRENALVEVDENNRITYYKAKDGGLELKGGHSLSAKTKTALLESKRTHQKLIRDYFENKNLADAVPKNNEEKEMCKLIQLISEKCENVNSPLNITQLTKDFNKHFGFSRTLYCIHKRIRRYCHEIQKAEFLDPSSKLKQLFGLSATLDLDYLEKLRKEAIVKVDSKYRITEYTSNDGRLKLKGRYWGSNTVEKSKKKNSSNNEELNDSSDEYSSEKLDSEFDSDHENDYLSSKTDDCDHDTPARNRSSTEISVADNLDFNIPSERSHESEETRMGEDKKNDSGIRENLSFKTRSGRLSKRRHLDFSDNQSNSGTNSLTVTPAKQRKRASEQRQAVSSSNQSRSSSRSMRRSTRNSQFSSISTDSGEKMENQDTPIAEDNPSDYHSQRIQEMEDYDYNPREDNLPESSPIDNRLEEPEPPTAEEHDSNIDAQNTHNRSDAVASEPHPEKESLALQNGTISIPQTNGNNKVTKENPIKIEQEEVPTEGVKPKTIYNSKLKFFKAMQSLILYLDAPSLSNVQSKIHQKIRKIGRSDDMISNDELIPVLELLVARMANHSVIDISEGVESVSLIQFFCYLKASIINSKMAGMEGSVENISKRIEESQNKRYAVEKVANALSATLDIDGY